MNLEFYETLPGLTSALAKTGQIRPFERMKILDPCSGNGAIVNALKAATADIPGWEKVIYLTNDIDPTRPAHLAEDAATTTGWITINALVGQPDWVITNPPFSQAHKIIPKAIKAAREGVAMLLPLRFQEPTKDRLAVLWSFPWDAELVIGQPRPSFDGQGTDSVTVFWAIWQKMRRQQFQRWYAIDPKGRWESIGSAHLFMPQAPLAEAKGKVEQ